MNCNWWIRFTVLTVCVLVPGFGQTATIQTIAGGYVGDGGLATQAGLYDVRSVTFDSSGTMYLADKNNNRVRRITVDGRITTLAGTGESLFRGDGGPATQATFWQPQGVAVDSKGRIYVADILNGRVRRINTDGTISTIAGDGTFKMRYGVAASTTSAGYPKSIFIDKNDVIYVADSDDHRVFKLDPQTLYITLVAGNGSASSTGDNGPASAANVNRPYDIAVDAQGNVYIVERDGNRIRRIDLNGIITTICGAGGVPGYNGDNIPAATAQLNSPNGLWADGNDLYVADSGNNRIRRIRSGVITTVAGTGAQGFAGDGGPALNAVFNSPFGVRMDPAGNLYITDAGSARIRRIDRATGIITTVAGTSTANTGDSGPAAGSYLRAPSGLVLGPAGGGTIVFTDSSQNRVRAIDANGLISTLAGADDFGDTDGPAAAARFNNPTGLASDGKGNYFVADTKNHRVRKIDAKGNVTTVAGTTKGYAGDNQAAVSAKLNGPTALAIHPKTGELYVSDAGNDCVRKVDARGIITTYAGQCTRGGSARGDGGAATSATLSNPAALLFNAAGDLLISDLNNYQIRRVDATTGNISNYAGSGQSTSDYLSTVNYQVIGKLAPPFGVSAARFPLQGVQGMSFDAAGNLYVAMGAAPGTPFQAAFVVRINAADQTVSQVGGGCMVTTGGGVCSGFLNDGGPASQALLQSPAGIAVGPTGTVYLADSTRIRTIGSAAATSLITVRTQPSGLNVLVDGRQVNDGSVVSWIPGSVHQLSVSGTQTSADGNTRYVFTGWSGGVSSSGQSAQLTAPSGTGSLTATFKSQFKLSLVVTGNGAVVANPQATDGGFYDANTAVQLTAVSRGDFAFQGFSPAADGVVVMVGPQTVQAVFQASTANLSVSPGDLAIAVKQGDTAAPTAKQLIISSTGAPITFGISASDNYLTLDVPQNTTPAIARVSVNPKGLAAGTYNPILTINGNNGVAPIVVPIQLTVSPNDVKPDMVVSPGVMNVQLTAGTQTATQSLAVNSSTGAALRLGWNVNSGSQWMLVEAHKNSSVTPAILDVTFSPAGLAPGQYSGRIQVTSSDASAATAVQTILVNLTVDPAPAAPAQLLPSVSGLTFQYQQKSGGPAPAPPLQTVAIASSQGSPRFYPSASVLTSKQWLTVTTPDKSNSALAPAALSISVDPTGLAAGVYEGSVDLRLTPSSDIVARVPVQFSIAAAPPSANLITDRTPIQFQLPAGSAATPIVWSIQSPGSEGAPVSVSSPDAPAWLNVSPGSATAGNGGPAVFQVSADATNVAPGTYSTTLIASSGSTQLTLPVTLTVTANAATLVPVQKSVTVTGQAGSLISRNLDLSAVSSGPVSWQATSDSPWLQVQTPSGQISTNGTGSLSITVDSTQLPVGVDTSGTIQISSPQTNSTEVVTVVATIYAANQPPYLSTAGVVLTGGTGGGAFTPQTVTVTYPNHFGAKATLIAADPWVSLSASSIQTDATLGRATFGVSAAPAGLQPGVYQSFVFVNFGGTTALNLSVLLVVAGGHGGAGVQTSTRATSDGGGCTPTKLIPVFAADLYGLRLRLGDTANIDFVVVDDCGNLQTSGGVSTNFSTSDRPADLSQVNTGVWRASWIPRLGAVANGIQFSVSAASPVAGLPTSPVGLQASISGTAGAPLLDYKAPFVSLDGATQVIVVAPGSRFYIRGTNLSPSTVTSAAGAAFLGNTSVTIGGLPMTLMGVSPTQIEAIVPSGVGTEAMQSIVVSNGGSLSAPERIAVASAWPTVVLAGMARHGGVDLVLTGLGKAAAAGVDALVLRAGGSDCRVTALQAIRSEPGLYYAHATGCSISADQPMEAGTAKGMSGAGVGRGPVR